MKTPSYHRDLLLTRNYTGIAVMAEGLEHVLPPGGIWDQILMDYLLGKRAAPVWGIGEIDFKDDTFSMTETMPYLLVEDLTKNSVLDALGRGRAYAADGANVQNVSLESFRVEAPDGRFAIMGDEIEVGAPPPPSVSNDQGGSDEGDPGQGDPQRIGDPPGEQDWGGD